MNANAFLQGKVKINEMDPFSFMAARDDLTMMFYMITDLKFFTPKRLFFIPPFSGEALIGP